MMQKKLIVLLSVLLFAIACKEKEQKVEAPVAPKVQEPQALKGNIEDLVGRWESTKQWPTRSGLSSVQFTINSDLVVKRFDEDSFDCDNVKFSLTDKVYSIKCKFQYPNGTVDDCTYDIVFKENSNKAGITERRGDMAPEEILIDRK